MYRLKSIFVVLLLGLFSISATAQFQAYKGIDEYLDSVERNDLGMGNISIFKNGKEIYQRAFGFQNIEKEQKTSFYTRYRIGSISKTLTATMVMQLVEEGKLTLKTTLDNYFPQLPNADKITIEHLLRHRSGWNEIVRGEGMEEWIQSPHTQEEILAQFVTLGTEFQPDEKQAYNNNGYVILSYILEKIDGQPFAEILKNRLTDPYQLKHTYYGKEMGLRKNEAISYEKKEAWEKSSTVHYTMPLGAGGIISRPKDLNIFIHQLFNHKIIQRTTLNQMLPLDSLFGFGLMSYELDGIKAIGHTGGIDGFRSWVLYFPTLNVSIAYDTNAQSTPFKELVKKVFSIYQEEAKKIALTETIFEQDSLLFDAIFNRHDAAYLKNILTDDFEFYHDKSGLTTTSAEGLIKGFERIWKKQEAGEKKWQRRKLIRESLEVFPLNNYGVVQMADHLFYEIDANGQEEIADIAKIVHLWKETDDGWKITRIVSYDHQHIATPTFEINAALEEKINAWIKAYNVPAVGVGLINDGKITYSKTFGEGQTGVKATNKTIFKVASITKPVVATTVFKMVDMGLWDLDEPLHKYWIDPDIADDPRTKKLTTRLILNMQSGLPNWRHLSDSGVLEFLFEPGEKVEYSGEGFEYLKHSMEAKFNRPLEDIVQRILFDKQDMNNIRFWWNDTMDENLYAWNYDSEGEQYEIYKYHATLAAGNILATVDDYLKFGVHVLDGAGISNNLYATMTTPQSSLFRDLVMYGNGWMSVKLDSGEKMIYHDGRDPGVRTIIQLFPNSKQGFVILTNGDNGDKLYYELLKELSPKTKNFVDSLEKAKASHREEMKKKKAQQEKQK